MKNITIEINQAQLTAFTSLGIEFKIIDSVDVNENLQLRQVIEDFKKEKETLTKAYIKLATEVKALKEEYKNRANELYNF